MSDQHSDEPPYDGPDEIIAEVRAIREEIVAEHGYDLDRLFAALKRKESESDRAKVPPAPKRLSPVAPA